MEHLGCGKQTNPHPLDMPIRGKIPAISGLCSVYHTTRLCERLVQPKSDFDLTDPNGYLLSSEYSSLHDPNLSNYLHRKDIHQRLLDLGFITKEQKIICSLKELNRYRDHLVEVELDWSRRFLTEQKELVRKFLNLKQQGQIPEHISLSDVTEWLLHRGRRLFSKRQQAIMTRSFPDNYTRLPKIAMRSNVVDLVCCPSSPCRSKRIWNAKGRALLHEVTKEVKREMRLEQHMLTNRQKKEKANQEKQQKRMCFKGCKKKRHSLTKTDPQDSPESMGNTFGSDPDNTQVDLVGCATTSISAHQPSSNPEQKCEGLSAVCQDMIESMNQKSPISYHNLCAKGPGLVDTISSSLIPRGILLGQGGYLQSITKQLSEIEQRLLEEHIKGTITAEELHGIMQSVVVSVVEEVNRILIPAIMAFEVERRTNSISTTNGTSSDVPTYSSLSYSDSYKTSSVSGSQKSSSPVIELSSEIPAPPTMLFKPTPCVIRQETFTVSVPEKDNREPNIETERGASCFMDLASSSSPSSSEKQSSPSKTSPSATSLESSGDILKSGTSIDAGRKEEKKLLVKAGAVIQEVIWRAAEAEGDKRDGGRLRNMSHAEKVETDSKTIEAVSRDIRGERRVEGVENNVDAITTIEVQKWENFADSVAKTVVLEVLAIADTTTKTDHSEVSKLEEKEMIADVTPKTESKELATAVVVTENVEAEKGDTRGGVKVKTDVKEGSEITKLDIQVAKAEASFDSKNKWTEMLDPKTEEADADINKPEQDKTVAQNNRKRYDFILLAGESKTEMREKHRNAKESLNNTPAEMSEHLYGSHELSQSISNDDDGALMFPMISMLKNAAISSDQVNEILDKVVSVLTLEGHEVILSEDSQGIAYSPDGRTNSYTATAGSRPSSEPLCCVSRSKDQVIHVHCPGEDPAESHNKLLGGQASILNSLTPMHLSEKDLSDTKIVPYVNSIINIIMQNMHEDNEFADGQKLLCPKRQSSPAFLTQHSPQYSSEIPVLNVPKTADLKSITSQKSQKLGDLKALRLVKWVLQTIQRHHSRQGKKSQKFCEVIQVLLKNLEHKMVNNGDQQAAPSQTNVLHTDNNFKTKLQETTVASICNIIEHLSTNVLSSMSCLVLPKTKSTSLSTLVKSCSLTNLGSQAVATSLAMEISSKVIEKLKESSGRGKATCSLTSLRDFVRAMTINHPELSKQAALNGSKIHQVYVEVLEMVVSKLRGFATKGDLFHQPREHLAQTMAESCADVECAFTEVLQMLKSHKTCDEAGRMNAVDHISTTISDTMFKRVSEGHHTQVNTKLTQKGNTPPFSSISLLQDELGEPSMHFKTEKQEHSPSLTITSGETMVQHSHSINLNVTPMKEVKDVLLPRNCKRQEDIMLSGQVGRDGVSHNLAHVSGETVTDCGPIRISDINQQGPNMIQARMTKSSVNLLQTTVEKLVHKLMNEHMALLELKGMSTFTSPDQEGISPSHKSEKDPENLPQNVQRRLITEFQSDRPEQPESSELLKSKLKGKELIGMLCTLMTKSIISSLTLDSAFQVPVGADSDEKDSKTSVVKLGVSPRILVPTPPLHPTLTNSQKNHMPVHKDSRRRNQSRRTLKSATRVISTIDCMDYFRTPRRSKMVAELAYPMKSNNCLSSKPPRPSAATPNTSLAASEITENMMYNLEGDSPDLLSLSSPITPSPSQQMEQDPTFPSIQA